MISGKMLGIVNDKLVLDVFWFLLLCAILAFFRFHHRPKNRDARKTEASAIAKKAA